MPDSMQDEHRSPWSGAESSEGSRARARRSYGDLIVLAVFLLAAGGVGFFIYTASFNPAPPASHISLAFEKPDRMFIGEPFPLAVSITNYSDNVLKNAKLSLFLPDGVYFVGQSSEARVSEQAVGDIGPGTAAQENFDLIVLQGNAVRRIEAKVVYGFSETSGAQFENTAAVDLLLNQPAVAITVNVPQSVFNGQDFDLQVTYRNNGTQDVPDATLELEYPKSFRFKGSDMPPADARAASWNTGAIRTGATKTITIHGAMTGPEKASFTFLASLKTRISGAEYTVHTGEANVVIAESPLAVSVDVNKASEYIARLGETLTYTINYKNNADVALQSITLRAKLTGDMFDTPSLRAANAYFTNVTQTLTWSSTSNRDFLSLAPGQSGSVYFSIRLKDKFPIRLLSDKNYVVRLDARIESPTVPSAIAAESVISFASMESKITGKMDVAAEAYWRDAASGIVNEGNYPPQANQPTEYTVHWRLVNYATDVKDATVSAYLQPGTRFTGVAKSVTDTTPTYNPGSGLVTWQIPFIPATKGFLSPPAEAVFQVEVIPSVNQAGSNAVFLGETSVRWTDAFTGEQLAARANELDTSLPHDTTITEDRSVRP